MASEFEKYARLHCGISSLKLHDFQSVAAGYVSPTIIEERQLNVAQMDVFSRLMMDRIIFLGAPIYDDAANIIQAQLLFLESVDPEKDIQLYINSPGGSVTAGLGIYDTMQLINCDVATVCTGMAAGAAVAGGLADAEKEETMIKFWTAYGVWLKFIPLILFALLFCNGCWDKKELNQLALAQVAAIDYEDDSYQVTLQLIIPGAEHAMSYYMDREKYEETIKSFWRRYD